MTLNTLRKQGWKVDRLKFLTQLLWIALFYAVFPSMWLLTVYPENQAVSLMLYYLTYQLFRRISAPPMYRNDKEEEES